MENRNHTVSPTAAHKKTHTLVFSFCHKGTIKKLHHGVLLFVFGITESETQRYIYVMKQCGWDERSVKHTFHWQPAEMHPPASQAVCGKTHWHPDMKTKRKEVKKTADYCCSAAQLYDHLLSHDCSSILRIHNGSWGTVRLTVKCGSKHIKSVSWWFKDE